MTRQEEEWQACIQSDNPGRSTSITSYRFIFFSFPPQQMEPVAFKEAINEFFARDVPVLWENEHEGVIIEENPEECISFETIIDIFMHDLSVKIRFCRPLSVCVNTSEKSLSHTNPAGDHFRKHR